MKKNTNMGKATKWYYDLSSIMKQAHEFFKKPEFRTFGTALKYAWAQAKREAKATMRKMEQMEKESRKCIDIVATILCDMEDKDEREVDMVINGRQRLAEEKANNARMIRALMDMPPEKVVDGLKDVSSVWLNGNLLYYWRKVTILLEGMGVWA